MAGIPPTSKANKFESKRKKEGSPVLARSHTKQARPWKSLIKGREMRRKGEERFDTGVFEGDLGENLRRRYETRQGKEEVLNFPSDYISQVTEFSPRPRSYSPSCSNVGATQTFERGSSSGAGHGNQVIEFECLDDKILEELLETEEEKKKRRQD
ncbi:ethylene-responsive transcription factor ERF098-like [Populus alba x Populus x berolinensis]|uniref:Ethylene-responsive transcription factor ERF098-like n=1 Tax=Populus alba x Populus x berolinensis TaxID=444605 RepID=A0AAD6QDT5_9ROSI|nr:ethylene-responsive transcription factor ERF098-like [Populus alba x Populus x berolinensis]